MLEFDLLNDLVLQYHFLAGQTARNVLPMTVSLATILFTINFAWDTTMGALRGTPGFLLRALRQLIVFLMIYGFILLIPFLITAFLSGFEELGIRVTGVDALKPSNVFDQGVNLALTMFDSWSKIASSFLPHVAFFRTVTFVLVLASFTILSLQLARILIETTFALSGLTIFLAFAAHRMTFGLAEGFLRYLAELGIRIYVIFLILAVARNLGTDWDLALQGLDLVGIRTHLSVTAAALLLAILAWTLPNSIASRMVSTFRLSTPTPLGGPSDG